ncbi:hypothetical protein ACTWP5_25195 [Streptomyces sp. 4N509B]|uniref:hypothetical protein n=1 Tax=Streptomyces sp. 4N509B TaxID=3457413 RepID=UPI003FD04F0B
MPASRTSLLARAERFLWLTARVLERRRFAYHFRDGDPDSVESALGAYRNPDHGFGHALDPDVREPASQPLHAVVALRALDEIGRCDARRTERICHYLTGVSAPDGALPTLHPTREDAPVAPWLAGSATGQGGGADASPAGAGHVTGDLLATGPVAGLLHRNGVWHAWLFRATDFAWAAVERQAREARDPRRVLAALAFLDGAPDRPRAEALGDRLGRAVRHRRLVVTGQDRRGHPLACAVARSPTSLARRWFTDGELERSLDLLAAQQQDDGGWPLGRRAWPPGSTATRRAIVTVEALRTLRAYGRL